MANNRPVFRQLIIQPNININLKSNDEHPPLYYAFSRLISATNAEGSYAEMLFRNERLDPNPIYTKRDNNNLLQVLLLNRFEEATLFLLNYIEDFNYQNLNGETALHLACKTKCARAVEKLLQLEANPNLVTNESRQTPLHYAVIANALNCVRVFIGSTANFNARDANGDTPISLALNDGCTGSGELVPALIEGGADVNVRNGKDFTLLHQAILKEDSATAIFLLDNGADINAQ